MFPFVHRLRIPSDRFVSTWKIRNRVRWASTVLLCSLRCRACSWTSSSVRHVTVSEAVLYVMFVWCGLLCIWVMLWCLRLGMTVRVLCIGQIRWAILNRGLNLIPVSVSLPDRFMRSSHRVVSIVVDWSICWCTFVVCFVWSVLHYVCVLMLQRSLVCRTAVARHYPTPFVTSDA